MAKYNDSSAERRSEQALFNAARAREDANSPFELHTGYYSGPKNCSRDIRICLAKLDIEVWHDTLTGVDRIDDLDGFRWGSKIDKQVLGALSVKLNDKWPKFRPPVGLLEKTIRAKAREKQINPFTYNYPNFGDRPSASWDPGDALNTWLIDELGAADTPTHRMVARAWMIEAARCAMQPGAAPLLALAFEGIDAERAASMIFDYPPLEEFLLERMIHVGGRARKGNSTRCFTVRCGNIDLASPHYQPEVTAAGSKYPSPSTKRMNTCWYEAAYCVTAGESVLIDADAVERTTNPYVEMLSIVLAGVEGKIRKADVLRMLGLDPADLGKRDARHQQLDRAMALLGWGARGTVRWQEQTPKGWSNSTAPLSLTATRADDGTWSVG